MDPNLNPMTEVERDYYAWSVAHREKHGQPENPEIAHVYRRSDNNQKIILFLSHAENFARWYSSRCSRFWAILLKDGVECYYDEKATRILRHGKSRQTAGNYPMTSYAAGGHVEDTEKMMQEDSDLGIRETHYVDGDPEFRTKGHRKEYLEKREMYDRNAGYSDPAPKHR